MPGYCSKLYLTKGERDAVTAPLSSTFLTFLTVGNIAASGLWRCLVRCWKRLPQATRTDSGSLGPPPHSSQALLEATASAGEKTQEGWAMCCSMGKLCWPKHIVWHLPVCAPVSHHWARLLWAATMPSWLCSQLLKINGREGRVQQQEDYGSRPGRTWTALSIPQHSALANANSVAVSWVVALVKLSCFESPVPCVTPCVAGTCCSACAVCEDEGMAAGGCRSPLVLLLPFSVLDPRPFTCRLTMCPWAPSSTWRGQQELQFRGAQLSFHPQSELDPAPLWL